MHLTHINFFFFSQFMANNFMTVHSRAITFVNFLALCIPNRSRVHFLSAMKVKEVNE